MTSCLGQSLEEAERESLSLWEPYRLERWLHDLNLVRRIFGLDKKLFFKKMSRFWNNPLTLEIFLRYSVLLDLSQDSSVPNFCYSLNHPKFGLIRYFVIDHKISKIILDPFLLHTEISKDNNPKLELSKIDKFLESYILHKAIKDLKDENVFAMVPLLNQIVKISEIPCLEPRFGVKAIEFFINKRCLHCGSKLMEPGLFCCKIHFDYFSNSKKNKEQPIQKLIKLGKQYRKLLDKMRFKLKEEFRHKEFEYSIDQDGATFSDIYIQNLYFFADSISINLSNFFQSILAKKSFWSSSAMPVYSPGEISGLREAFFDKYKYGLYQALYMNKKRAYRFRLFKEPKKGILNKPFFDHDQVYEIIKNEVVSLLPRITDFSRVRYFLQLKFFEDLLLEGYERFKLAEKNL
jgi:hypothetical protein